MFIPFFDDDEMNSLKTSRKNTFGNVPFIIAKYLGLSNHEVYTDQSLRRISATLLTWWMEEYIGCCRIFGGYYIFIQKNEVARMLAGIRSAFRFLLQKLDIQKMKHESIFAGGKITSTGSFQICQFYGNSTK